MRKSLYTITFLLGFLAGVGLFQFYQPGLSGLFWVGGVSLVVFVFWMLLGEHAIALSFKKFWRSITLLLLFVFAICFGLVRATLSTHPVAPEHLNFYNENEVAVMGVIREVDVRRDQVKYTVEAETVSLNGLSDRGEIPSADGGAMGVSLGVELVEVEGEVLITLDKYPRYVYGDRVKIVGELLHPGEFDGFNYGNYLSRYGIYSVMYRPDIEVLDSGNGHLFWSGMLFLREQFMQKVNRLFPEPHASFEAGLLVGARKGIPDDLMEKFNITGLTHIIAISGYNITIIIVFVMWMLGGLPRKVGFVVAMTSIILFTLFVGASPAVVRAAIMGILGLFALNAGRQSNIHILILFTAFLMVLWNPKTLWWDAGFQLSFAAVLGLIYIAPLFDKYAQKLPQAFGIREAIQLTLSAQVTALPIILYHFDRLSLIAPVSNLLVAFAIPPAMLFGFIAVLISFVSPAIALLPAYLAWAMLSYIIQVIEWTALIPYASIDLPGMTLWMMGGYYVLLVGLVYWRNRKSAATNSGIIRKIR